MHLHYTGTEYQPPSRPHNTTMTTAPTLVKKLLRKINVAIDSYLSNTLQQIKIVGAAGLFRLGGILPAVCISLAPRRSLASLASPFPSPATRSRLSRGIALASRSGIVCRWPHSSGGLLSGFLRLGRRRGHLRCRVVTIMNSSLGRRGGSGDGLCVVRRGKAGMSGRQRKCVGYLVG